LAALPADTGFRLRVAFDDHLVQANSPDALPIGSMTPLRLAHAPRLLPWHGSQEAS
jgi:hypothetical protein